MRVQPISSERLSSEIVFQPPSLATVLLLSMIAGSTDTIGFFALGGLFTAHVTGNVVLLSGHLAMGGRVGIAQLISVPVFMVVVALTRVYGKSFGTSPVALMVLQLWFLACFMILCRFGEPFTDLDHWTAVLAGMSGIAAMATQNVLVQSIPEMPATATVTVDITRLSMAAIDLVLRGQTENSSSRRTVMSAGPAIAGFVGGCCLGAALHVHIGTWALAFPVALAATLLALHMHHGAIPVAR